MRIHRGKIAVLGTIILVGFVVLNITLKDYNVFTFILGQPGELRIGYSTRIIDTKEAQQIASPDYAKENCLALQTSGYVWDSSTSTCKKSESTTTTDSQLHTSCINQGGTWNFSTKQCVFGSKPSTTSTQTTQTSDPVGSFIAKITGTIDPAESFSFTENARCVILTDTKVTAIEYKDFDNDGDLDETFKISTFTDRSAPYPSGVLTITSPQSQDTGEAYYDLQVYVQCLKKTNTKLFINTASDMYVTVQAQNSKKQLVTVASSKLTVGKIEIPHDTLALIGTVRFDAGDIEKNLDNGIYESTMHFFTHGKLILNFDGFDKPDQLYQIDIPQSKDGVVNYHKLTVEKEIPTKLDCKPPLLLQGDKCVQPIGEPPESSPESEFGVTLPFECFQESIIQKQTTTSKIAEQVLGETYQDITKLTNQVNSENDFYACLGQKKFIAFYTIGFIGMIILALIFRPARKVMIEPSQGY